MAYGQKAPSCDPLIIKQVLCSSVEKFNMFDALKPWNDPKFIDQLQQVRTPWTWKAKIEVGLSS